MWSAHYCQCPAFWTFLSILQFHLRTNSQQWPADTQFNENIDTEHNNILSTKLSNLPVLTLRAIFFSLFIAENCFNLVKTAGSRGLSGATPSTQTQGWPAKIKMGHLGRLMSYDNKIRWSTECSIIKWYIRGVRWSAAFFSIVGICISKVLCTYEELHVQSISSWDHGLASS